MGLDEVVSDVDSVGLGDGLLVPEVDSEAEGLVVSEGEELVVSDGEELVDSDPLGELDGLVVVEPEDDPEGDASGEPDSLVVDEAVGEDVEVGETSSPDTVPGWSFSTIARICSL